jgi:hypothetical protein
MQSLVTLILETEEGRIASVANTVFEFTKIKKVIQGDSAAIHDNFTSTIADMDTSKDIEILRTKLVFAFPNENRWTTILRRLPLRFRAIADEQEPSR